MFLPDGPRVNLGARSVAEGRVMGGKRPLWIPLAGGLSTDIADDLLPLGRSLDITNMQLAETGKLVKRFGNTSLSTTGLSDCWQLAPYKGTRANVNVLATGASPIGVSTYSPAKGSWVNPATDRHSPLTIALSKISSRGGNNPRCAVGAGYNFLLYQDSFSGGTPTMHFDVVDATTNMLVSAQTFTTAGAYLGYEIVFCNGFAVAVTDESGIGIVFRTMTPATLAFTTTTFAALPVGFVGFDAMVKNATTISVVYQDNTNLAAAVDFVPSTLTTTGWAPRDATAAAIQIVNGAAWMTDLGASGKQALVTAGSVQGIRVQWDIPAAGATRQAVSTYNADPAATANVVQIEGHTIGAGATGDFQVLITTGVTSGPAPLPTDNVTKMAIRTGGVLTAGFNLYRSITLLSKAFVYSGDFYALFCYPSDLDSASYAMRIPMVTAQPTISAPQAIFGVGSTGNMDSFGILNGQLVSVTNIGVGAFVSAVGYISRLDKTAAGSYGPTLGIEIVTLRFIDNHDPTSTGTPIEAFDSLLVPGGAIGVFDGLSYGELGWSHQPPQGTLTPGAGGALTPSSTYWYCFVWGRMDGQGRLWRSAPSIPQSVLLGGAQNRVTVAVPTNRITGYNNVFVEVYRGAANDSEEFQKLTQVTNDLTVDTINYVDNTDDLTLAVGEPLYTNGGILPNTTIPGSPFVFTFQNRLWFISADDPTELWFSNKITPKNGVRFNPEWIVRIADERGPIFGCGAMADKVVAIKESATYAFDGEGPDDAGAGAYNTPQIVALGIGSNQPRSIVASKDGVFFDSTSNKPGIQMIDRGLSIAKDKEGMSFGAAVQRYSDELIMSAVLIPEQSHVRFYCRSGRVLVYDLVAGIWTTFLLNLSGDHLLSAMTIDGGALIGTDGFNLYSEDLTGATYFDGNAGQGTYTVTVETPWIQGPGPKGFERVSEMIGTGRTVGDHTLTVDMFTDLDDATIVNTKNWALTVAANPRWNWEWIPRVQRMGAFKVRISETSIAAGFEAEGITAWVGVKPGLARQPTTTRGP
jgi:hypothetical protein